MKLINAVEEVLEEDPRCRQPEYSWMFMTMVLRKLGYNIYIKFDRKMPSPETIFREKREIMNKKNKYSKEFVPEKGVTIEMPKDIKTQDE